MDFQSLTALYANKTDDELLQLAAELNQLTFDAQNALRGELGRRRLAFEEALTPIQPLPPPLVVSDKEQAADTLSLNLPVGDFITNVFRFYHRNRWTYMKLMFPAVAVGTAAVLVGRGEAHEIARNLPRGLGMARHPVEIIEMGLATWGGFFVSWIAFCFSFAAISAVFEQVRAGHEVSIKDSLSAIRERLGPLVRVSLLLWASLIVLVVLAGLAMSTVAWVMESHFVRAERFLFFPLFWGAFALVALILSRFGLAIPAVVLDDSPAGRAMFRSDELTEGKWSILAVLLSKSIVGGYIAGMLPFWLVRWIPDSISLPSWFPWVLTGASIAAVTLVEPIMFIGFALLYEKTNCSSLSSPHKSATHAAFSG